MKYVVLIYSNPTTWEALPKDRSDRVIRDHFVVIDELTKSGELLNQFGLADPIEHQDRPYPRRRTRP